MGKAPGGHYIGGAGNMIGWFQLAEPSGTVAIDKSGRNNATHTGVSLGKPGVNRLKRASQNDGATTYTNLIASASLLNGNEGAIGVWATTGAWTDGVARFLVRIEVNTNNRAWIARAATNNRMFLRHTAGGTDKNITVLTAAPPGWFHTLLTWSLTQNKCDAYFNSISVLETTNANAWVGTPTTMLIGAGTTTPTLVWNGNINHVKLYNKWLNPFEVRAIYLEEQLR